MKHTYSHTYIHICQHTKCPPTSRTPATCTSQEHTYIHTYTHTYIPAYRISFIVTNPISDQTSPTVIMSASGTDIAAVEADKDPHLLPLRVFPPQFVLLRAGQQLPYPCALNIITVTVAANVPMQPGSGVVLSGITGARIDGCPVLSATPCNISIYFPPVPVAPGNISANGTNSTNGTNATVPTPYVWSGLRSDGHGAFGTTALWDASTLTITFRSTIHGPAGKMYLVSFVVRNPVTAQESPAISARGTRMNLGDVTSVNLPAAKVMPDVTTNLTTYEVRLLSFCYVFPCTQ
jgi:hypothetical protein